MTVLCRAVKIPPPPPQKKTTTLPSRPSSVFKLRKINSTNTFPICFPSPPKPSALAPNTFQLFRFSSYTLQKLGFALCGCQRPFLCAPDGKYAHKHASKRVPSFLSQHLDSCVSPHTEKFEFYTEGSIE